MSSLPGALQKKKVNVVVNSTVQGKNGFKVNGLDPEHVCVLTPDGHFQIMRWPTVTSTASVNGTPTPVIVSRTEEAASRTAVSKTAASRTAVSAPIWSVPPRTSVPKTAVGPTRIAVSAPDTAMSSPKTAVTAPNTTVSAPGTAVSAPRTFVSAPRTAATAPRTAVSKPRKALPMTQSVSTTQIDVTVPRSAVTVPKKALHLPRILKKHTKVKPTFSFNGKAIPRMGQPVPTIDLTQGSPEPAKSRSKAPTYGSISLKPWSLDPATGKATIATPASIVQSATSNSQRTNNRKESLATTSNNGKRNCNDLDQSSSTVVKDVDSRGILEKVEPFQFVCVNEDSSEASAKKIKIEAREEYNQNESLPENYKLEIIKCLSAKIATVEQRSVKERTILKDEIITLTAQITRLKSYSLEMKGKLKTIKIENLKLNKMLVNMETKNAAATKVDEENSELIQQQRSLLQTRQDNINFLTKKNQDLEKRNNEVKDLAAQILKY